MKGIKNIFSLLVAMLFVSVFFLGCEGQIDNVQNNTKNIPAGYIGRVLTPTGWQDKIYEAGQVDLGRINTDGQGNVLVLLEATSIAIKEQFLPSDSPQNADKVDHRVVTKKKIPLTVDCYVRMIVPDAKEDRNNIFALITPQKTNDPRIQKIALEAVYNQFAKMDVRGKIREIFTDYEDDTAVIRNMRTVNKLITTEAISIFKANKVPLKLQNCQLSNMNPDEVIRQANIKNASAEMEAARIATIGKAVRENPGYIQYIKWDVIGKSGVEGVTVIDNAGASPIAISPK